jgi:hypothetical protein
MDQQTINGNISGNQITGISLMNGVFYDGDLDTQLNHVPDSIGPAGHRLTMSISQKIKGTATASTFLTLTPSATGIIVSNNDARTLAIAVNPSQKTNIRNGKEITVTVRVTDENNDYAEDSFDVNITNSAPTITLTCDAGNPIVVGTQFTLTIVSSDNNEKTSSYNPTLDLSYVINNIPQTIGTYFTIVDVSSNVTAGGTRTIVKRLTPRAGVVSGSIRVSITDSCGAITSSEFALNIGSAPEITTNAQTTISGVEYDPIITALLENQFASDNPANPIIAIPFKISGDSNISVVVTERHNFGVGHDGIILRKLVYMPTSGSTPNQLPPTGFLEKGTSYALGQSDVLNGVISFNLVRYWNGATAIRLTATDANGNSAYEDITISVSPQTSTPIKII